MNYPSIRIEGSIFSPDIVDRLDEAIGQRPGDFGLDSSVKVKDEIARAWADAQDYWRIFQRKLETVKPDSPATTETRSLWIIPLLSLLGYNIEREPRGKEINSKSYPISHRVANRANTPIHVIGYNEPGGLDRKPERAALRMSAHAMLQEYLNLSEDLYGLVTNGHVLRLLRDSSRLIKLTYLEFDLDRIFTDGLFADFAILYRLLHASRLPARHDAVAESLLEKYHQDSLDSGSRIREGLSKAVESAILGFGNGFLTHPENQWLQDEISSGRLKANTFYQHLLRLIYRLLFLMVIEERGLVFPDSATPSQRRIYQEFYSVQRVRRLSERRYLADKRKHDLWLSLLATFRLFEATGPGRKLGLAPLAGDLFSPSAISELSRSTLSNDVILGCLRSLSLYQNPINGQLIRVNYAALNVEELGSVYEGLLKFEALFERDRDQFRFDLKPGPDTTQSHYTPDDLVQPLIKHSLDYLIADRLKAPNPKQALLDLRVADISCGSGHILLAAARRIATELAILETGEDQPSPSAFRSAIREVIRNCIYGVDLNPLAVELCKVALWLEAHNPGEPLNFLDHHIKCGNAIIGYVRPEDVDRGVPDEAFATQPGDDKDVAAEFRKVNKKQRKDHASGQLTLSQPVQKQLYSIRANWTALSALPERTPAEVEEKKAKFTEFAKSREAFVLSQIASIPIAQFYIPKTEENRRTLITDERFRLYWNEGQAPQGEATALAWSIADSKRFFNWFLEFPEIVQRGGFDCILGNPPYLGGTKISTRYGANTFTVLAHLHQPVGGHSDFVAYFFRRVLSLLKPKGVTGLITTDRITQGDTRAGTLETAIAEGAVITFARRSVRWPGAAAVHVSLVVLFKERVAGIIPILDGAKVESIQATLESGVDLPEPKKLQESSSLAFAGSYVYGEGFVLSPTEAQALLNQRESNIDVVRPFLIGNDINQNSMQLPSRYVIDFRDWPLDRAQLYPECLEILTERVKPIRDPIVARGGQVHEVDYWKFWDKRLNHYARLSGLKHAIVVARTGKHAAFTFVNPGIVYSDDCVVVVSDSAAVLAVLQSSVHFTWILRNCTTRGTTIRYSVSKILNTFPMPLSSMQNDESALHKLGQTYYAHRSEIMERLELGLTDVYNFFHDPALSERVIEKVSKKSTSESQWGYDAVFKLRRLQVELDSAVRDAYGWDIPLDHDFYEVETLPENDRVRYTISPAARKELLKLLLAENHRRAAAEAGAPVTPRPAKPGAKKSQTPSDPAPNLFAQSASPQAVDEDDDELDIDVDGAVEPATPANVQPIGRITINGQPAQLLEKKPLDSVRTQYKVILDSSGELKSFVSPPATVTDSEPY